MECFCLLIIIITLIIFIQHLRIRNTVYRCKKLKNYPIYQSYTLTPSIDRLSSIYILSSFEDPVYNTQHSITQNDVSKHEKSQDQLTFVKNYQNQESIQCDSSVEEQEQSSHNLMISSIEQIVKEYERKLQMKQICNKTMNIESIQYLDQSYLSVSQQFSKQFIIQNNPNVNHFQRPAKQNKPVFDRSKDRVFPNNPFLKKDTDIYQEQSTTNNKDKFHTELYKQGQKLRQQLIDSKQYNLQLQNIYSFLTQTNKNNIKSHHQNITDKLNIDLLKQFIAYESSNRQS